MHSSRMRTGRSLTVCCSLLPCGDWGGCLFLGMGVSAPGGSALGGGVCSRGVSALGGVCSRGSVCSRGGVCSRGSVPGGVCSQGVSAPGGVCSRGCLLCGCLLPGGGRHPPLLWTEFLTHACENITLAQLHCGR